MAERQLEFDQEFEAKNHHSFGQQSRLKLSNRESQALAQKQAQRLELKQGLAVLPLMEVVARQEPRPHKDLEE